MVVNESLVYDELKSIVGPVNVTNREIILDAYMGTVTTSAAAAKTQLPMLGEYYNLLVKLKRMLDPNRIMNPGKFMDIEPY